MSPIKSSSGQMHWPIDNNTEKKIIPDKQVLAEFEKQTDQEKTNQRIEKAKRNYQITTRIFLGFGITIFAVGALSMLTGLFYHYGVLQAALGKAGIVNLGSASPLLWNPIVYSSIVVQALGGALFAIGLYRNKAHRKIMKIINKSVFKQPPQDRMKEPANIWSDHPHGQK